MMVGDSRIEVCEGPSHAVVRFLDQTLIEEQLIEEVDEQLQSVVQERHGTNLLLDFAQVRLLGSAVLPVLIRLRKTIKTQNGQLKLCNMTAEVREVFAITRLDTIFDIQVGEVSKQTS
jgi:anti-sigma B factor antagonist